MPNKKISELLNKKKNVEELTSSDEEEKKSIEVEPVEVEKIAVEVEKVKKQRVKKPRAKKEPVINVEEEENENEELDESEESETEPVSSIKKPKKIKSKSDLKKYQNDKLIIKEAVTTINTALREFKFDIMKIFKMFKNEEIEQNDCEDIINFHNEIKAKCLDRIYSIENSLAQQHVKMPSSVYSKIDECFDSAKQRIEILIN